MFTQVTENEARAGRKTPEEVGREGLYRAIVETYSIVFPAGHPCHVGPEFGKVAQEGHPSSTFEQLKKLHLHAICQFPSAHKWKRVEQHLREVKGIKVHIAKHPCYKTMFEYISKATAKKPASEIDTQPWTSPGHPPEHEIPEPDARLMAMWRARTAASQQAKQSEESMKVLEFYDVVRGLAPTARDEDALWTLASQQQENNDRRLMQFMLGRRDLPQLLERISQAEAAPQKSLRAQQSRMQVLEHVRQNGRCML